MKPVPIVLTVALIAVAAQLAAQTLHEAGPGEKSLGTIENGVYHHNLTGIEFSVPGDWVMVSQSSTSTPGAQVVKLRNTSTSQIATIWMKRRDADPTETEALMKARLDDKLIQRNNFQNYKYREESVQYTTIGGRPALSAIADYKTGERPMVECLTWVDGDKSRVVFVGRIPASELAGFETSVAPLIQSAIVP